MRFPFFFHLFNGQALAMPLHARTLAVADRAKSSTLSRDGLLARHEARDTPIARDPVYGRAMTYRAVPAGIVRPPHRRRARFLLASSPKRTGVSS